MTRLASLHRFVLAAWFALLALSVPSVARAATITLEGSSVFGPGNCIPFGGWAGGQYMGFVYKNVPPFTLRAGDTVAFDLGEPNDYDLQIDLAMAPATNGTMQPSAGFTTIAVDAVPTSARGDSVRLNYELVYRATASFNFPGGGLAVRILPKGAFAGDTDCTQVLYASDADDTSGYFVGRFYGDPDGVYPWSGSDSSTIGVMRIVYSQVPTSLVVSGVTSPLTAGGFSSVTVEARDANGNRVTNYTGTVRFTSSDGQATLPGNSTFTLADGGIKTIFGLALRTAGTQSVTATDTVTTSLTGSQTGIVVNPAAATTLSVTNIASPRVAGVSEVVVVEARDQYGNRATGYRGTVRFTSSDGQATLPANSTFTAADAGIKTISGLVLKTVGTHSVTATDTVTSSITGAQGSIVVTPAAASTFVVNGISSPRTAGAASNVTVEARDPYGNRATGYRGTIRFTSTDGQAALPANYAFTSADAGIKTLSGLVLTTVGTHTVTATDTVTSAITGAQGSIVVTPAAASALVVSGIGNPSIAGTTSSMTVDVRDSYGNRATGYTGTIRFTSSDSQAALPANYTFTSADAGFKTLSGVVLKTVGTHTVTATDTVTTSITGAQGSIVVTPAAASALVVSGISSPRAAGVTSNVVVEARDAFGNRATGYTGTIRFTSSDSQAALPANYTFASSDAGIKTLSSVVLKTVGTQIVIATDTVTTSITGAQNAISVTPATASTLVVSGISSPRTAGASASVTVEARDSYGNRATGYTGTIRFTSSDAQAVLPANFTFASSDAGIATFTTLVLKTVGTHTVTATDTVTSAITGAQGSISVTPGPAASFIVGGITSPRVAGTTSSVTVEARDAYGNRATGYTGTVRFTSSDSQAALPANDTFTSTDAGFKTIAGVVLKTVGTQTVTATDTVTTTITGNQGSITVTPAAAASLAVSGISTPRVAGTTTSVTVEARDAFGNRATGYTGTVRFTSSDTQAVLPANSTFTSTDAGTKTIAGLVLKTVGTQTVSATDTVTSSITGTQSAIAVTPAAAASLVVSGISTPRVAGTTASVTVEAKDAYGNRATGYTGTIRFTSTDAQAVLPANFTFASADAGLKSIAGVVLKTAGTQTVTATDTVTSAITGAQGSIAVTPAAAASLALSGLGATIEAGAAASVTVRALDAYGNVATGYLGTVTLTSTDPAAELPAAHAYVSSDAGVFAFPGRVLLKTAGSRTVRAADAGGLSGTVTVTVTASAPATTEITGSGRVVAGTRASYGLQVRDAFGNAVPGTHTLTVSVSGGSTVVLAEVGLSGATAGGTSAIGTTAANGSGTAAVRDELVGARQLCVSGSGFLGQPACLPITIAPDVPDHLRLAAATGQAAAGEAETVSLQVLDQFDNEVPAAVSVSLAVTGRATFGSSAQATTTFDTDASNGRATVRVTDEKAEEVTVSVTDAAFQNAALAHVKPHGAASIAFSAAPAHSVAITAAGDAVAGEALELALQVVDRFGNPTAGAVDVCVEASGAAGAPRVAAGQLAGATQLEPGKVCGSTDPATGAGTVRLTTERAEPTDLKVTSSGLPGSGSADGRITVPVSPAAPHHLRLTAADPVVDACGTHTATVRLVDAFDNAVVDEALTQVPVKLHVTSPTGTPTITGTTLAGVDPAGLPAHTVEGTLGLDGSATAQVRLDADDTAQLTWESSALPGDPAALPALALRFQPGPVDADKSELTSSGARLEAGFGRITVRLVPKDSCGVKRGDGETVSFSSSFGSFSAVKAVGGGAYQAIYETAKEECPADAAKITAFDGQVQMSSSLAFTSVCSHVHPDSKIELSEGELPACASGGTFATLTVWPEGDVGPLAPGQEVSVEADGLRVVQGTVTPHFDEQTRWSSYSVQVGSDRCGETRAITVKVNGVELAQKPEVHFTCPAIDPATIVFKEKASLPADGETRGTIRVFAKDTCGHPAFARKVTLREAEGGVEASIDQREVTSVDLPGDETDGSAAFTLSSTFAGKTSFVATFDGVERESEKELLTFLLTDVLKVEWTAAGTSLTAGTTTTVTARLTSSYGRPLTGITLAPALTGFTVMSVDGAQLQGDGKAVVESLAPNASVEVVFHLRADAVGSAKASVVVTAGAQGTEEKLTKTSEELSFTVAQQVPAGGCGCGQGEPGAFGLWTLVALLGLAGARRRSQARSA